MKAALTSVNVIGLCLFALVATLQLNDNSNAAIYENPSALDVILWCMFYAYIAMLHGMGIFRPVPIPLLVLGVLLCLLELTFAVPSLWTNIAGGAFTLAGDGMQASDPQVERSREFFGACIALTGVIVIAAQRQWWASQKKPNTTI
ncbi:MAG: hypothetical protein O3C21_03205 [Verrucomicrobia bacterium]|nr:hypothetical protein [Verrucomicrobiota bacterium]